MTVRLSEREHYKMRSICDNEIVAAPLKCLFVLPLVLCVIDSRHFPIFLYVQCDYSVFIYHNWMAYLQYTWKMCSVAQPRNYNRQSLASLCTRNYTLTCVYKYSHSLCTYVQVFNWKSSEGKKNCGTGSDNTTLCILFTVVSTYKVPFTTTSVYNALELRTMKKKVNVSTESATHPPQHDNYGDAYVISIKTGYKWLLCNSLFFL